MVPDQAIYLGISDSATAGIGSFKGAPEKAIAIGVEEFLMPKPVDV